MDLPGDKQTVLTTAIRSLMSSAVYFAGPKATVVADLQRRYRRLAVHIEFKQAAQFTLLLNASRFAAPTTGTRRRDDFPGP